MNLSKDLNGLILDRKKRSHERIGLIEKERIESFMKESEYTERIDFRRS